MYQLNDFDPHHFLQNYWQKKPVVIRHAFVSFDDPLDEHDLAGLAQEPEIDSRIISQHAGKWSVDHGPFADFEELCQGDWTILVQGVDKVIDEAADLLSAFSFVPQWRMEDLMVSYSVAGGGVGPHLDQYDVFIVQGKGSRRWRVGCQGEHETVLTHPQLKQIASFEPIIDEILNAGDLIYIPPGFPHEGIALEPCLNYSVGFRAPSQKDLLEGLADYASQHSVFNKRYSDPSLGLRESHFEIKQEEIHEFRLLMQKVIESDQFVDFLGHYLTENTLQTPEEKPDYGDFTEQNILTLLQSNVQFEKALDARFVLLELNENQSVMGQVWMNGFTLEFPKNEIKMIKSLLNSQKIGIEEKISYENSLFFVQFLTTLVSTGCFFPVENHE